MTPREQAAFNAGIEAVRQAALIAAVTIETREAGCGVRDQAAVAALQGLAEGARSLMLGAETDKPSQPGPAPSRAQRVDGKKPSVHAFQAETDALLIAVTTEECCHDGNTL